MKPLINRFFHLDILVIGFLIIVILALPWFASTFWQYLVCTIMLLSLFSLSFNLLFGMAGYLPFGHMCFYATGAYITGLLMIAKIPLLPAVLLGTVAAGILALIIGFFCVRHTFVYFSLLSLAFGMIVYAIIWKWTSLTGGDDGLIGIPRGSIALPGLINIKMESSSHYYYFLTATSIIAFYIVYRICRSPFGLILNGLRDNLKRVEFAGVPTRRYLLYLFILAGLFAGLTGALMAPLEKTLSPAIGHWSKGAEPLFATLIGGPLNFWGPIVGAVIFIGLKETIVRFTSYWLIFLGILLLVLVLGFRGGIVGFIQDCFQKRWKNRREMCYL